MRRGATLLELAVILAIVGLLSGIALPRLRGLADSLAVERAARDIVSAHRRARMSAVLRSRVVELTIASGGLAIRPRGDSADAWHAPGPAATRVTLAGPNRVMAFSPVGISIGVSNATFQLSRGGVMRRVVVSRLGRVRVLP